ncbi:ATP-dependent RNA helicase HrpA, partial [Burkholderia multivorans]|uniref:DUF3418 domain-containing protein n=1 Tax=Burkholderia multivorans TaxID=87883 RepID=UPI000DB1C8D0
RIASREAVITLLALRTGETLKYLQDGLTTEEKLVLAGHQKRSDELLTALIRSGVRGIVESEIGPTESSWVGGEAEFARLETAVNAQLIEATTKLLPSLITALRRATELDRLVSNSSSLAILSNLADVQAWAASRVSAAAIAAMTPQMVAALPKWVEAEKVRIGAMVDSPMRDRQLMDRVTGSAEAVSTKIANRFPGLGQAAGD